MGNTILLLALAVVLFLAELAYFRIAARYNIVDNPNFRSSHDQPVIRGGGILFFVGLIIWFFYEGRPMPWFMVAATLVALVSFVDDISGTTPLRRFTFHSIAMLLAFYQLSLFAWPVWLIIVATSNRMITMGNMTGTRSATGSMHPALACRFDRPVARARTGWLDFGSPSQRAGTLRPPS